MAIYVTDIETAAQADYTPKERADFHVWITNAAIAIGIPVVGLTLGYGLGEATTGNFLLSVPLGILGATAGVIGVIQLKPYAFVNNDVATWFVTKDRLLSLLGRKDFFMAYGPGVHPSYLWEERIKENSIIAKEISQEFDFTVKCSDGILKGKGSFRLRPNPANPLAFLTSVAAASQDLIDLIIVEAVNYLANTTVLSATKKLPELNAHLKDMFETGDTDFEKRFSVQVGDATVSQLLPSEETQRTISALTEAAVIKKGTAMFLSMSVAEMTRQQKAGTLSKEAMERARRDFMSVSGNFDGMTVDRKEYALEGLEGLKHLTPEAVAALTALAIQLSSRSEQQTGQQKPTQRRSRPVNK